MPGESLFYFEAREQQYPFDGVCQKLLYTTLEDLEKASIERYDENNQTILDGGDFKLTFEDGLIKELDIPGKNLSLWRQTPGSITYRQLLDDSEAHARAFIDAWPRLGTNAKGAVNPYKNQPNYLTYEGSNLPNEKVYSLNILPKYLVNVGGFAERFGRPNTLQTSDVLTAFTEYLEQVVLP